MRDLQMLPGNEAYLVLLGVIVLDGWLLYRFFSVSAFDRIPQFDERPAHGYVGTRVVQPD